LKFRGVGILSTDSSDEVAQVNLAVKKILVVEIAIWVSICLILVFVLKFLKFFLKGLVFFALLVNNKGLFVFLFLLFAFFVELVVQSNVVVGSFYDKSVLQEGVVHHCDKFFEGCQSESSERVKKVIS
jgi:hypothetical protein